MIKRKIVYDLAYKYFYNRFRILIEDDDVDILVLKRVNEENEVSKCIKNVKKLNL